MQFALSETGVYNACHLPSAKALQRERDGQQPQMLSPDTHAQRDEAFAKIMPELLLIEKKVRKKITLLVHDPDASRDVWQEVLITTWQHAEDLLTEHYGKEGREDWIYRVAHNKGVNYAKARDSSKRGGGRSNSLTSVESLKVLGSDKLYSNPETEAIRRDTYQKTLQQFSPHAATIVAQFIEGYSCKEIANNVGITQNAVGLTIFKARKKIVQKVA